MRDPIECEDQGVLFDCNVGEVAPYSVLPSDLPLDIRQGLPYHDLELFGRHSRVIGI